MDNYKLYANIIRKPDSSDFNARPCNRLSRIQYA